MLFLNLTAKLQKNISKFANKKGKVLKWWTRRGWCLALLLSEINPERADTLFARAYMYGVLQSNPTFREDMKAAQQEFLRKNNKK